MTKNILVTGANGQLGNELRESASNYKDYIFHFTDIEDLDITDYQSINNFISNQPIDFLINCAAYTAVDKAEQEPEKAKLINIDAVRNMVNVCNQHNAVFIHISTDYVFGGEGFRPYTENHKTSPVSTYAITKLGGEEAIIKDSNKAIIIRTSWLYSKFGHNFLKTMLKYGRERAELKVVFDQIGTPTLATDLAEAIMQIIIAKSEVSGTEIYHYSNEGVCSWYDFALAIMEEESIDCKVVPILTKDYPLPASRPYYSVLDKSKIKTKFALEIPHWRVSLRRCLRNLQ